MPEKFVKQEGMPEMEGPQALLERTYIDEYLKSKGYESMKDLCSLTAEEIKMIMIEACKYASAKLAEVESRAQFQHTIHG